jgi:hypothetical protein
LEERRRGCVGVFNLFKMDVDILNVVRIGVNRVLPAEELPEIV